MKKSLIAMTAALAVISCGMAFASQAPPGTEAMINSAWSDPIVSTSSNALPESAASVKSAGMQPGGGGGITGNDNGGGSFCLTAAVHRFASPAAPGAPPGAATG